MKRAAAGIVLLALTGAALAGPEKPILPGPTFCLTVKNLEPQIACARDVNFAGTPADILKDTLRNWVWGMGFNAANSYFPPPLTKEQERYREAGWKVMEAAPGLAFPEIDQATASPGATGSCFCSSTVGDPAFPETAFETWKLSGKGRCQDAMICFVKGIAGKGPTGPGEGAKEKDR